MKIARAAVGLADRPVTVLLAMVLAIGALLIAPTVDQSIPVLSVKEVSEGVWIGKDRLGWTIEACRARGGPIFTGVQFNVLPADGSGHFPLRGVADISDDFEEAVPQQLPRGVCRSYSYGVSISGQAVSGDLIYGVATYKSSIGWWSLFAKYGSVVVPSLPGIVDIEDRIIQRQLEDRGMGLEALRK